MDASLVPGQGHREGPNIDTKSYRATSQPPRLMLPLTARSSLAALTGEGDWGEATGNGED